MSEASPEPELTPTKPSSRLPLIVTIVAVTGLIVLAYWQVVDWILVTSPEDSYSMGGLVAPAVTLYLAWLKRDRLREVYDGGSNAGLWVVAIAALMFFAGSWTGIHYAYAFSLIVLIWGLIMWLAGKAVAMELLFPVAFLFFMIPLTWAVDVLTFPLRLVATRAAALLPRALGLHTVIEGTNIHVGGYSLLIDLPCSGLRSIMALMAGAALFAYLADLSLPRKWVLFLSSIPIAVVANIVRIDSTLLIGKSLGKEFAEGTWHTLAGLVVFAVALVCLFYVWRLLCPRSESSRRMDANRR